MTILLIILVAFLLKGTISAIGHSSDSFTHDR